MIYSFSGDFTRSINDLVSFTMLIPLCSVFLTRSYVLRRAAAEMQGLKLLKL